MIPFESHDQFTKVINLSAQSAGDSGRLSNKGGFYSSGFIQYKRFLSGEKSGGLVKIITALQIQSSGVAEGGITVKGKRLRNARAPLAPSHG